MHFTKNIKLAFLGIITYGSLFGVAVTDTCANFHNFDLTVALNAALSTSIPDIFGNLNSCLCVSQIPSFIASNVPSSLAVSLASTARTTNALTLIIQNNGQVCTYPAHSAAQGCTSASPCDFTCTDGYTKTGNSCSCLGANTVCSNGNCAAVCPSGVPSKRSQQLVMKSGPCPTGWDVCGGRSGPHPFKCINTKTTLESCGGCVLPLHDNPATGTDCSALPGVNSVGCRAGKCHVKSCIRGWNVSEDKQSCV